MINPLYNAFQTATYEYFSALGDICKDITDPLTARNAMYARLEIEEYALSKLREVADA